MSTTLSTPFVASSIFKAKCHPLTDQVVPEVERYFTSNWQFKTEEAKRKFLSQGLIRLACLYNALAVDDRIALACKLTTILFFSDDALDHMSFLEGAVLNKRLMSLAAGEAMPDRGVPLEHMTYDTWQDM